MVEVLAEAVKKAAGRLLVAAATMRETSSTVKVGVAAEHVVVAVGVAAPITAVTVEA